PGSVPAKTDPNNASSGSGSATSGSTIIRRLNRIEYNNTVRDLVGDEDSPANQFPPDPRAFGFDNNAEALTISPDLVAQYFAAADGIAGRADLRKLVSCDPASASDACVRSFIATFGKRAFRRPLAAAELDDFFGLYRTIRADDTSVTALRSVLTRF